MSGVPRPPRGLPVRVAAGLAVLALAGCALVPGSVSPVDEVEFTHELPVPPLAPSRVVDGTRVFSLTAQEGTSELVPGVQTPTWGFDGPYLGPTLRAERGERVAVEVTNDLPEPTSVHWHGMHLPAAMDGGPHQEVEPGGTWRPTWRIDQPAATLWYHPHPHGQTEKHVYRGLAGLFLLDDDASVAADLPHDYGVDDVPVIVQDKVLDDDGTLELDDSGAEPGTLGDVVLTNGATGAYHDVTSERVRLRLLNGSTARTYQLGFPDRRMDLVATDGGLLEAPVEVDDVRLAPGERAEVVVRLEPGETTRLHSFEAELGGVVVPFAMGGNDAFDVLELRAADRLTPSPEPAWTPSAHAAADALHADDATVTRTFQLDDRQINGRRMDMGRIDETATVGTTEVWEVRSTVPMPHSFHVHDVQFRILSVDGDPPPPALAGPKDTVYLEPNRTYRLLMRFEDYTDPDVPYMFHCHMLWHEDQGMMGQFVVVEPGQEAGTDVDGHAGHH
ncbi:multicopper oxidase family protein [Promicromonospora thailandica]|uniref:Multicopper oxidase with three cupredoxin domains (Includes cell division protein FtsP and spore coat protein CotA) n=1 Tax=Promicromonospora thailandica TaxID=765201 RepID=A0A9X2JX01_9MICO|nr:multicopper oxidase domain-containing protein [Promicromonospora thailandica]MCP2265683.1 Multicopper oxidase with three cupredoxin domains (includes cell division protein FtsP and spore coat protein CotA) [Promicromonospora thailandica]BFF21690.1 multicopper oxidase domain-containing protein [Promicromonospora thailandica]